MNDDNKELSNLEILESAGFIVGEYPHHVPVSMNYFLVLTNGNVPLLPSAVQQVYIQSSFKLFSFWLGHIDVEFDFQPTSKLYTDQLQILCASEHLEVRQRVLYLYTKMKGHTVYQHFRGIFTESFKDELKARSTSLSPQQLAVFV